MKEPLTDGVPWIACKVDVATEASLKPMYDPKAERVKV